MPKRLTDDIKTKVIEKRNVAWVADFEIRDFNGNVVNSELYRKYLTSYNFSLNRKFSSSTARLTLQNPEGQFSPENSSATIKKGFTVRIWEYYQDFPGQKFDRFYGLVRQINPVKTSKGNSVELFCYDMLVKLQDTDIEKTFESQKFVSDNEVLTPNLLPEPTPFLAQVFDGKFSSWANNPTPIFQVQDKQTSEIKTSLVEGFEIHYENGQVVLNSTVNTEELNIKVSYHYYKTGLWAEDILEGILLEKDEFGESLFESTDLETTLEAEENVTSDTLYPITYPLNMTAIVDKKLVTDDSVIYLLRKDSWKFAQAYEATVGTDTVTWTGKVDVTEDGIEYTKLTGVTGITQKHSRGSKLSVYYSVESGKTRVWRCTYNNISDSISSSDFTIPGATYETFDKRFGILLLNQAIDYSSAVKLNKNYTFKTLQATGIEIPYLRVTRKKYKNRFDVIKNEILRIVPPNYVVLSRGTPKVWAMYMNQRPNGFEDYSLDLNTRIQYIADQEIYTRATLFGKNRTPKNIMLNEETKVLGMHELGGTTISGLAVNQELFLSNAHEYRPRGDYLAMTPFTDLRGRFRSPDVTIFSSWEEGEQTFRPTVKIDGVSLASRTRRVIQRHVCVDGNCIILDHNAILPPDGSLERAIIFYEGDGSPWGGDAEHTFLAQDVNPGDDVVYFTNYWGGGFDDKAFIGHDQINFTQKYGNRFEGVTGVEKFYPAGTKLYWYHPLYIPFADNLDENASRFNVSDREGRHRGYFQREGGRTVFHTNWAKWWVGRVKTASYSVLTAVSIADNKPAYYVSGHKFYVNRDLLQTKTVHKDEIVNIIENPNHHYAWDERLVVQNKVTATFRYRTLMGRVDNTHAIKDGNPRTEAQMAWLRSVPLKGQKVFIIDFGSVKKIQAIDIVAGRYYPYKEIDNQMAVDCNFTMSLQASTSQGAASLVSHALKPSTNTILSEVVTTNPGQLKDYPDSGTAYIGNDAFNYTSIARNVTVSRYRDNSRVHRRQSDQFRGVTGISEDHRVTYENSRLITSAPFSEISSETSHFNLKSGDSVSFEEGQLGEHFEARLLAFVMENVERVDIARGRPGYPISIASLNVYSDVEFRSDAKLSRTTKLTSGVISSDTIVHVESTVGFPDSGQAFIGVDEFSYTGKTTTSFTGVSGLSQSHVVGSFLTKENVWEEEGEYLIDPNNLLSEVGDKVYKDRQTSSQVTDEANLKLRARKTLAEVYKNHNKVRISNVFAPYTYVGQTLRLKDPYSDNFKVERNYFIESINSNNGKYEIEAAYYP